MSSVFKTDGESGVGYLLEFAFGLENRSDKAGHDPRIKSTLIQFLAIFSEDHPKSAISYVCDSSDRKAHCRSKLFDRWFKEYNSQNKVKFEKENLSVDSSPPYLMSMVFRADHPNKETFVDLLRTEVVEFMRPKNEG